MRSKVNVHYGQRSQKDWERDVLDELKLQLDAEGATAEIFTNFEMVLAQNDRELDIAVVLPDLGIAVIEVKGGEIRVHDGEIERHERGRWESAKIKNQLQAQRSFIRTILKNEDSEIWQENRRIPVATLFVTPHSDIQLGHSVPGLQSAMVIGNEHLSTMLHTIKELLLDARVYRDISQFSDEQYHAAVEALTGSEEAYEQFVESRSRRGLMVEKLTSEQMFILDVLQDNPNTLILGASGSGKTVVAVEQAVRLKQEGKRVALVCYNLGLANHLKKTCDELDDKSKPDFVGSIFGDLPGVWSTDLEEFRVEGENFWEESVPRGLAKRALIQSPQLKFDAWVIDEAQDFKKHWWDIVLNGSKKPSDPHVHLFGDLKQDLYSRHAEDLAVQSKVDTPWFYAIGRLSENLRNVRTIARILNLIGRTEHDEHGRYTGFATEFHQVSSYDDVHHHAEKLVQDAIDAGWAPGDIAVLNAYRRFKSQPDPSDGAAVEEYWREFFAAESVFYGTALGFKGLDRPVVIVCLDDPGLNNRESVDNDLYVAFGRARDELTIVGTETGRDLLSIIEAELNVIIVPPAE